MTNATHHIRVEADPVQYERMFDRETGLPRWSLLLDRTTIALARAHRVNRVVAVFVLDDRTFDGELPTSVSWASVSPPGSDRRHRGPSPPHHHRGVQRHPATRTPPSSRSACSRTGDRPLGVSLGVPGDTPDSLLGRALDQAAMTLSK
jgi:hypothetical protein